MTVPFNNNVLFFLADQQNLNRKQFNKLFPIKRCRVGLFSTNRKFLTTEQIDEAIADGGNLHILYSYNANMLNEQQLINAVDKEIRDYEDDISYLFESRTKAVSDEFIKYCCGEAEGLYGDDIEIYGRIIMDILKELKNVSFLVGEQRVWIIDAIDELKRIIADFNKEKYDWLSEVN